MKTKIQVKKYVISEDTRNTVDHLLGPNASRGRLLENAIEVALEYNKLEKHHEEETKFLIARIEELEKELDSFVKS